MSDLLHISPIVLMKGCTHMSTIEQIKHQARLSQWAEKISNCQSSGLTVTQWCRDNEINAKKYYYWLKKVREQALLSMPQDENASSLAIAKATNSLNNNASENLSFSNLQVQLPSSDVNTTVTISLPQASVKVTNGATQQILEAVLLALKAAW